MRATNKKISRKIVAAVNSTCISFYPFRGIVSAGSVLVCVWVSFFSLCAHHQSFYLFSIFCTSQRSVQAHTPFNLWCRNKFETSVCFAIWYIGRKYQEQQEQKTRSKSGKTAPKRKYFVFCQVLKIDETLRDNTEHFAIQQYKHIPKVRVKDTNTHFSKFSHNKNLHIEETTTRIHSIKLCIYTGLCYSSYLQLFFRGQKFTILLCSRRLVWNSIVSLSVLVSTNNQII